MNFTRQFRTERLGARRLIGLAVLVGILASLVPLPMFDAASGAKERSQPFPCQNRPCGCRSAEQCWKKCCCFTNAQKVAWAKSQGLTPPAFVLAAAAREQSRPVCIAGGCEKCRSAAKSLHVATSKPQPPAGKQPRQLVVIALMQKCQGSSWFWNSLPWSTPVVVQELRIAAPEPSSWEPIVSESPDEALLPPPVPPPRCAPAALAG